MSKKQPPTYTHTCPTEDGGCGKTYTSTDAIPNFCPVCITTRRAFYAEIERRVGSRPRKPTKSDYQLYMEECNKTGTNFPRA